MSSKDNTEHKNGKSTELIQGINNFGWSLLANLLENAKEEKNKTVFVTPINVCSSLASLLSGSKGKSIQELLTVMKIKELDQAFDAVNSISNDTGPILHSLWVNQTQDIKDSFKDVLVNSFGGSFRPFSDAVRQINLWGSDTVNTDIEMVSADNVSKSDKMLSVSLTKITTNWQFPFDDKNTKTEQFTSLNGEKGKYEFLNQKNQFEYFEDQLFQAVNIPFKNKFTATIILPNKKKDLTAISEIVQLLSGHWDKYQNKFEKRDGEISLPKFALEYNINLIPNLKQLGITSLFSKPEFSHVSFHPEDLNLTKVVQHVLLEITESNGGQSTPETSDKDFSMKVDSAFILLIRDTESQSIIMMSIIDQLASKGSKRENSKSTSRSPKRRRRSSRSPRRSSRSPRRSSRSPRRSSRSPRRSSRSPRRKASRSPRRSSRSPRRSSRSPRRRRHHGDEGKGESTALYVGNLPGDWTETELENLFEKYGTIVKVTFRLNRERRGYGFVTYEQRKYAQAAMDGLKGHRVDGETITLDFDAGLENKRKERPYYNRRPRYDDYNRRPRYSPRRSSKSPRRRSRSPPRR